MWRVTTSSQDIQIHQGWSCSVQLYLVLKRRPVMLKNKLDYKQSNNLDLLKAWTNHSSRIVELSLYDMDSNTFLLLDIVSNSTAMPSLWLWRTDNKYFILLLKKRCWSIVSWTPIFLMITKSKGIVIVRNDQWSVNWMFSWPKTTKTRFNDRKRFRRIIYFQITRRLIK